MSDEGHWDPHQVILVAAASQGLNDIFAQLK
jgi:hypothetical protein